MCSTHEENGMELVCPQEARMYHPITVEFLIKSQEYDRSKQRQAHKLHKSLRASESARPSRIQKGMDLLGMMLMHALKRPREAKLAVQALVWERASIGEKVNR
jgi:hypothetical protein